MCQLVSIIKQKNYLADEIKDSASRATELCGFDIKKTRGKRVLLKPNLLGAYSPKTGVTTHPIFIEGVASLFLDNGAIVSIGDSSNGVQTIDKVWRVTGMDDVCKKLGVEKVIFEASGSVLINGVRIAKAVTEADIIVNLPRFKTHGLTVLTLAVKNLFGCMNGMQKTSLHRDAKGRVAFATGLVDIAEAAKSTLHIMDAIICMEGNGPSGGELRDIGLILASKNMYAMDSVCCDLAGLRRSDLDTLAVAVKKGYWNYNESIELVGDKVDKKVFENFRLPATYTKGLRDKWMFRFILDHMWSMASIKPRINTKKCKRCWLCKKACPVKAIIEKYNTPFVTNKVCIECMCCHEVCPHKAIDLKRSIIMQLAQIFSG